MGEEFSSRGARAGYDVKRLSADRIAYYFPGDRKKNRPAVTDVSFTAAQGEILGIMGSSGSGKSTLLKLAAELLRPTVGTITYHGGKPRIGFLFQDDVFLPWRTVGGNVQYPLEGLGRAAETRRTRAQEICRAIHLPPAIYWERFPKELSGGERRRLSVGMAIAREVELLLLDEPTSQLDKKNK